MEVVSIWEGGSLPAVGFVNETERKHHLGWKVSAGLFLPAWTVWMPESKAVWGRPGGGGAGVRGSGSVHAGCLSLGGQRRGRNKRDPERREGGKEDWKGERGATETKNEGGDSGKRDRTQGRKCEASEGEGRRLCPEVGEGSSGPICARAALQAIGCPLKDS